MGKDDFSQDEKNFSKMNQTENSSFVNDDSLDWAKQAYLQLKQKQKEEKEILKTKTNTNEDNKSNIIVENSLQVSQETEVEDQPQLGDFDDTFTWSAEVLAAQGKKIDQFSLDDIDL